MGTRSTTHRGITLIELLVMVTIVAVLISLLLPAMAAARVEGQKTMCMTHLRSLAQLASAYSTEDPDGVYGPVHAQANTYRGEGYAEYGGGPGIAPYVNWDEPFDPMTRPFNKMIYGVDGLANSINYDTWTNSSDEGLFEQFRCPGAETGYQEWPGWTGLPEEVEQPYFKANGTSYRMNNLVWRDGTYNAGIGDNRRYNTWIAGIYARPVNRIPDSSITVGFMEARAFQTIFVNDTWGFLSVHGELSGYHKKLGYFNMAYVDGHVSFADMGNGTYYPRTLTNSYYDVRGKWGRMDCFPFQMIRDLPE